MTPKKIVAMPFYVSLCEVENGETAALASMPRKWDTGVVRTLEPVTGAAPFARIPYLAIFGFGAFSPSEDGMVGAMETGNKVSAPIHHVRMMDLPLRCAMVTFFLRSAEPQLTRSGQ